MYRLDTVDGLDQHGRPAQVIDPEEKAFLDELGIKLLPNAFTFQVVLESNTHREIRKWIRQM